MFLRANRRFKDGKEHRYSIRPIYHQKDSRIEAHIFVAFHAYCLQVTLKQRLRALAPGLTPRAVPEKFAAIQRVDVHLPATDGQYLVLSRYMQPNKDQQILLSQHARWAVPRDTSGWRVARNQSLRRIAAQGRFVAAPRVQADAFFTRLSSTGYLPL